jgi:hypothetical protein
MSTVNPNQGIGGSDSTVGDVIAPIPENPDNPDDPELIRASEDQLLDFQQFLYLQNDEGLDGSTMEATDRPGEYVMTTGDGQQFTVINTDEIPVDPENPPDPEIPLVIGEGAPNLILGGTQDVNVEGSDEDNTIFGNLGNNAIHGGLGQDALGGGAGDDALDGGEGGDTLTGGAGNDQLTGGQGADTFLYPQELPPEETEEDLGAPDPTPYDYGQDTITDFGADGDDDTLILGDFNNDGVFDSQDYTIENHQTEDGSQGALITFIGPDGSQGSVFLTGVDANQLNVTNDETQGLVGLRQNQNSLADQPSESPDQGDDADDDLFFTVV